METLRHQIARLVQRIMAYVKKLCKNKYILLWLGTHSKKFVVKLAISTPKFR